MGNIDTKQSVIQALLLVVAVISIGVSASSNQGAIAQMSTSNTTGSQNQTNIMMRGSNITGSIAIGPTLAKAIASQVHVSLANASTTAEKAVGANAHATAVRIGVVHGFLVYMALVIDSSNNFHGVIVDSGNGKVLASNPVSFATLGTLMGGGGGMMGMMTVPGIMGPGMMGPGPGMMGPGPGMMGPGMLFLQPRQVPVGPGMMGPQTAVPVPGMMGPGMSGFGMGMMQHGMMKAPGTMMRHP